MSWYSRAAIGILALGLAAALLCAWWPASAEDSDPTGSSGAEAAVPGRGPVEPAVVSGSDVKLARSAIR